MCWPRRNTGDLLITLSDKFWPVVNGKEKISCVNEVERAFLVSPFLFHIINLKLAIGRNPVDIGQWDCEHIWIRLTSLAGWQQYLHQLLMPMDMHRQHPLPIFLERDISAQKGPLWWTRGVTCHCQFQGLIFVAGSDLLVLKKAFHREGWYIVDV